MSKTYHKEYKWGPHENIEVYRTWTVGPVEESEDKARAEIGARAEIDNFQWIGKWNEPLCNVLHYCCCFFGFIFDVLSGDIILG